MWNAFRARLSSSTSAVKNLGVFLAPAVNSKTLLLPPKFTVNQNASFVNYANVYKSPVLQTPPSLCAERAHMLTVPQSQLLTQTRSLTKFSLKKGKRKSVKAVLKRFYRLNWGIWIRCRAGRSKRLFFKSAARKRRLRQHVFTNATQSFLLDKMVTSYWRKPKYYVDDPYEPYHSREEFPFTRKKPIGFN